MTTGTMIAEERLINPFLRAGEEYFTKLTGETDPAKSFGKLRKMCDLTMS